MDLVDPFSHGLILLTACRPRAVTGCADRKSPSLLHNNLLRHISVVVLKQEAQEYCEIQEMHNAYKERNASFIKSKV